jgi:prevent-host-death family protein
MTYTAKEAAEKLPEILERVKAGEPVLLTENGEQIAEIRPVAESVSREGDPDALSDGDSLEAKLRRLEREGILSPPAKRRGKLGPIAKRPGALARFLESR